MTPNSIHRAALLAAVAMGVGAGAGGSAQLLPRPAFDGPYPSYTPTRTRMGNNRKPGLTFAAKKRRRKIARASRRYNLRTGA